MERRSIKIGLILLLLFFCGFSNPLLAQEEKSLTSEVTIPVKERDVVYARQRAFRQAGRQVILLASKLLIGDELYPELESTLRSQLTPNNYFDSVKVLKEEAEDGNFTIKIRASVRITLLSKDLRELNIPLEKDKPMKLGYILDSRVKIPQEIIIERFKTLKYDLGEPVITDVEKTITPEAAKRLFSLTQGQPFLLLITAQPPKSNRVRGLKFRVIGKNDYKVVKSFEFAFRSQAADQVDEYIMSNVQEFEDLFTVASLPRSLFEYGQSQALTLNLKGLSSPSARSEFEKYVLNRSGKVKSYALTMVSLKKTQYKVFAKGDIGELVEELLSKNNRFTFNLIESSALHYQVQVKHHMIPDVRESRPYKISKKVEAELLKALGLKEGEVIPKKFIPKTQEVEPNNSANRLNALHIHRNIWGRLNSRADEDLYYLDSPKGKEIVIDWVKIGKTYLKPKLNLYDGKFRLLKSWDIPSRGPNVTVKYNWGDKTPERLVLRVVDSVGYIRGETGGFRFFEYSLQYYWR
ncbi:MAG: hypothetical protein QNL04_14485 [SAR324 cluster bacterium]|nr:hypothetical protein [SAR324 cluster bacterium]